MYSDIIYNICQMSWLVQREWYQIPLYQTEKKIITYYVYKAIQCDKQYGINIGDELTQILANITWNHLGQLANFQKKVNNNYNIIINSEFDYINDILQIMETYFDIIWDNERIEYFTNKFFFVIDIRLQNTDYDLIMLLQNTLYHSFGITKEYQSVIEIRTQYFVDTYFIVENGNTNYHNTTLYNLFEEFKDKIDICLYKKKQQIYN